MKGTDYAEMAREVADMPGADDLRAEEARIRSLVQASRTSTDAVALRASLRERVAAITAACEESRKRSADMVANMDEALRAVGVDLAAWRYRHG